MDTSQSPQEMVMEQKEEKIPANNVDCTINPLERKQRPQKDQALSCPRCNSTNTKFCYYNNYSLTHPRYFCKTCRRYWTEGGSLRNIPVGGGSRKNKRSSTNSSIASSKNEIKNPHDPSMFLPPPIISQNHNNKIQESPDLNFGFSREHGFKSLPELFQSPHFDHGITPTSSRGFSLFNPIIAPEVSDRNNVYSDISSSSSGFSMPIELKPSLRFSLYGRGTNNNTNNGLSGSLENVEQDGGNGRFLFPFEDLRLKQATTTPTASTTPTAPTDDHHQLQQNKEQDNEENSSGDIEMEY